MHIGRGASPSKTKCVFFPPPQFFQHAQCRNTAATLIQCAFRCIHTSTHPHQLIEQPAPSSTSPTDFPIGCRVVVASSHPTHAGKGGTVCKLTKKFVMFSSDDSPTDIIRILPKSLAAHHPDGRRKINSADDGDEHDPGRLNANMPCTTDSMRLETSPSQTALSASRGVLSGRASFGYSALASEEKASEK